MPTELPRKHYRPRPWVEAAYDLGLLGAFLAGLGCVIARGFAMQLFGSALLVVVAIQAILLFHDCMHQSAFAHRQLETWVARLIGAFYGCPFHFLRAEHLRHHRRAGLVDEDPEALHLQEADAARRPQGRLLARVGRDVKGAFLYTWILQLGQFARFLRRAEDPRLLRDTLVDVACMLLVWIPFTVFLVERGAYLRVLVYGFAIPAVMALAIVYLAAKPLHTMMIPFRLHGSRYAERQFCVTRTFETHRALSLLLCNLNYHLEHHLYPHVSRWDLPALSRELRPLLAQYAERHDLPLAIHDGYSSFFDASITLYNPIEDWQKWGELNQAFRYRSFHAPRGRS